MTLPFTYEHVRTSEFGGTKPTECTFDEARMVVLPIPFDRTTSYVPGTRNGPRDIILASTHLELWDEETESEPHHAGIFTLPQMEFPFDSMAEVMTEIERVATEVLRRGKFPVVLGGEHSIAGPVVAAAAGLHPGLSFLQIDAHADLRDTFMGSPHNHACVMRRVLERVPAVQVGIRSLSPEEAAVAPSLSTTIFYDFDMRRDPDWMDRVVASVTNTVYITIDTDAFDPAIMPATGTPEPGGYSGTRRSRS